MSGERAPEALLLSLPWTTLTEPSLGLALLKAVLNRDGVPCRVRHLNLDLLRFLQPGTYYSLANVFALNDFMFSGVLEPEVSAGQRRLLYEKVSQLLTFGTLDADELGGVDGAVDRFLELRNRIIPRWLSEEADVIAADRSTLVGFTCMFDQTIASLALARLIKQRAPHKLIALGGYAVRSPVAEMLLRACPWIDAVCAGEGEHVITPLAQASVGAPIGQVPGIVRRGEDGTPGAGPDARRVDLDTVPTPDFDDFFADVKALADRHAVHVGVGSLPLENSRGCWWGAKHHCIFCGIHDDDLRFRAKSATVVLEQLETLHKRHRIGAFRFSDYILPHRYYETLLPELIRRGRPYRLTSEIKANVGPRRFALLAEAGFAEVQPGIESFSSAVLRSMDKGVKAIQNVETLLLGRRLGVTVHYNLLYGLPDDRESDYAAMLAVLPHLRHLDAPATRLEVQITRYAPLQANPERFALPTSEHDPSYRLIFSQDYLLASGFDLNAFCYYFERPFENPPRLSRLYREIDAVVDQWAASRREREIGLWYRLSGGKMTVADSRGETFVEHRLDNIETALLLTCERPQRRAAIEAEFAAPAAVRRLLDLGLLIDLDDSLLCLALARTEARAGGTPPETGTEILEAAAAG